jgi:hypothetical protein
MEPGASQPQSGDNGGSDRSDVADDPRTGKQGAKGGRWKPSDWTAEVEIVLFKLARDRNMFDVPHGTTQAFWRDLLKEFDADAAVQERLRGLLKSDTARAHIIDALDKFERSDAANANKTGFGDEEYGDRQQVLVSLCQLRSDAELKGSKHAEDKRAHQEKQARLKRISDELAKRAAERAEAAKKKRKHQDKGAEGEGNPNKVPSPKPSVLAAQAINLLQNAPERRAEAAAERKAQREADQAFQKQLVESQVASTAQTNQIIMQFCQNSAAQNKAMVDMVAQSQQQHNAALASVATAMQALADTLRKN